LRGHTPRLPLASIRWWPAAAARRGAATSSDLSHLAPLAPSESNLHTLHDRVASPADRQAAPRSALAWFLGTSGRPREGHRQKPPTNIRHFPARGPGRTAHLCTAGMAGAPLTRFTSAFVRPGGGRRTHPTATARHAHPPRVQPCHTLPHQGPSHCLPPCALPITSPTRSHPPATGGSSAVPPRPCRWHAIAYEIGQICMVCGVLVTSSRSSNPLGP
jgi:hypothetical protein